MYGWSARPTKVVIKNFVNGAAVFDVGRYRVTVPGIREDTEVTYVTENRSSSDPRRTFPNMSVEDGVLKIYVEDIVDEMLTRLEPVDLARQLWQHADVKEAFMECMAETYMDGSLNDADRRAFLAKVKETVHEHSLRLFSDRLSNSEYELAKASYYWDQVDRANGTLNYGERQVRNHLGQPEEPPEDYPGEVFTVPRIQVESRSKIFDIGGTAWNEARDYWRGKVAELFPGPKEGINA